MLPKKKKKKSLSYEEANKLGGLQFNKRQVENRIPPTRRIPTRKPKMTPEEAMTKGVEQGLNNFRVR